ncbi:MAG: flagellar hook-associated protein FlgK [Candidatus Zixiibacteriota bacterium]
MAGIFQGLELAKRALLSHQYALTTAGHNIANAGTPGYSRQRVDLVATDPFQDAIAQYGTGVKIDNVRHIRDAFLTAQYRQGSDQLGRWSQLNTALQEVENIFLEPSDTGFNAALTKFFDAWHTLAQNPESSASRAAVRDQAEVVTSAFHQMSARLDTLGRSLDKDIAGRVQYINGIASDLARLNQEIARSEIGGSMANDLRDRRDYLIDELSKNVNVTVLEERNGITRIFIGSMELVENSSYSPLTATTTGTGTQTRTSLLWQGTQVPISFAGGELAGLLEARDELIPEYQQQLDTLAATFVEQVNAVHSTGYALDGQSGYMFFDPTRRSARDISLSIRITESLNNIAASQSGGPGDNSNAIAIANLQNSLVMTNNTTTFNEFFAQIVGTVGIRSAESGDAMTNADLVLQQIEANRQSVQGVSLDEEMANLIKAQHAYDAAAKVVATLDSALNTLINDMGVGR